MEFILKLICENCAERNDGHSVFLLLQVVPKLGRKSLAKDPWYKGLIYKPFVRVKYDDDCKQIYLNHLRHSLTEPAVQYDTEEGGCKYWYKLGKYHREDGPAIDWILGKEWWREGRLHRDDGPAIEKINGCKMWYKDGKLHREDGPAIITSDNTQMWYRNGKLHREDGAAVIKPDGEETWYYNGDKMNYDSRFLYRPF